MDETPPPSDPPRSAGEGSSPVPRKPLHEALVERLRALVYEGELAPGDKVPERALCERLGVSRTPFREAVKYLASEGLFELLPNRGARVTVLTAEDIDQMFQVMGALEALAGELACQHLTDDDLAEIKALHYAMALHHRRGELPEYFQLNQDIHGKIMAAAGNPVLAGVYQTLAGRIRWARYQANAEDSRWDEAMAEHEQILLALEKRDGPELAALLKDHLKQTCEKLKRTI